MCKLPEYNWVMGFKANSTGLFSGKIQFSNFLTYVLGIVSKSTLKVD